MSHYLLSIHHEPGVQTQNSAYDTDDDMQTAFLRVNEFNQSLKIDGHLIYACGLTPPEAAQQVAVDGTITAGPAVGGDKQLGGFWVIDVPNDAAAIEVAQRGAAACRQPVEVRPMQ